jgi:tetratricopeptide (TPR) repeat protein
MNLGRMQEAAESFQMTLKINPVYMRAKSKLIVCFLEMGRQSDALEHLACPDCLDKDTLELHYKTALLYCNRIKFASSLINLERHLEENFAYPDAAVNISVVLQNLGLLDRVAAMWDNLSDTANHAINTN